MLCYQNQRYEIRSCLTQIERKNKGYKQLKQLLKPACKYHYLSADLSKIKANTKVGRVQLVNIARTFCDLKIVTRKTIKTRGWTDKMIEQYLWVDVLAKNPYYKSAGDMKLYCLSRIQNLECFDPDIKSLVAINLARRAKLKQTKEQKLKDAPFKWLTAIGDPYIAIALLLCLLNKAIEDFANHEFRNYFYEKKERILIKLKSFKTQTFVARTEVGCQHKKRYLYCHWFDVNGYKVSFRSYESLGYEGEESLEQYSLKFDSKLDTKDKQLLFKLSGWQTISEAIAGLEYYLDKDLMLVEHPPLAKPTSNRHASIGVWQPTNNIQKFSPPKYPDPPTEDELFVLGMNRDREYMMMNFNSIKKEIDRYKSFGCPINYDCKYMGKINELRCANYKQCSKA